MLKQESTILECLDYLIKSLEMTMIVSFRKIILPNNEIIIDLTFNNISDFKKAEVIASEARLKQNMFGKIAHEFKTPLISLTSMLETMNSDIKSKNYPKALEMSKNISNLSTYTIFLIDDIIHYCYSFNNKITIKKENSPKCNSSNQLRKNSVSFINPNKNESKNIPISKEEIKVVKLLKM